MAGRIRTIVKVPSTGSAAIAVEAAPPGSAIDPSIKDTAWELIGITLHFSADPGVENLTITYNSANGSDYDTLLKTQAMSGVVDFWWGPAFTPFYVGPDDTIDIAQANASARTYGIEVVWGEAVA
jgi:hypothetical protein